MEKLDKAIAVLMERDQESLFALADIAEERVRQITSEGWSPEHDDKHTRSELAYAAASYAVAVGEHRSVMGYAERAGLGVAEYPVNAPSVWPWSLEWWKPKSPHRSAAKAGALLVAELARIYRNREHRHPEGPDAA